jgi:hypothetical protein
MLYTVRNGVRKPVASVRRVVIERQVQGEELVFFEKLGFGGFFADFFDGEVVT